MKIHYRKDFDNDDKTSCGKDAFSGVDFTNNKDLVSCKNCIRIAKIEVKPEREMVTVTKDFLDNINFKIEELRREADELDETVKSRDRDIEKLNTDIKKIACKRNNLSDELISESKSNRSNQINLSLCYGKLDEARSKIKHYQELIKYLTNGVE